MCVLPITKFIGSHNPKENPNAIQGNTTGGIAILGQDDAANGTSTGVLGLASSSSGIGVMGEAISQTLGPAVGVYGTSAAPEGTGIVGGATGGNGIGGSFTGAPSVPGFSAGWGVVSLGGSSSTNSAAGVGGFFEGGDSAGPAGNGIQAFAGNGAGTLVSFPIAGVAGYGPNNADNLLSSFHSLRTGREFLARMD
jgi:hypothetical protein